MVCLISSQFMKISLRMPSSMIIRGFKVKLLLFLFTLPFITSQTLTPQPSNQASIGPNFKPPRVVVLLVVLAVLFFLGFFSVYIKGIADRRFARDNPTSVLDGEARRSMTGRVGLDLEVIERFPTFVYSTVKRLKIGKVSLECAVCLNEFEDEETLRFIPKCSHVFHPECIDTWLRSHTSCPVCRADLVPTPGELPFDTVHMLDPVESNHDQSHVIINFETRDDRTDSKKQSQTLLDTSNRSRPSRSWSTKLSRSVSRGVRLFSKSYSTGHSSIQPGDNQERFTLRLSEELRNQLITDAKLNRTKSCMAFTTVRSSRRGFRSSSLGSGIKRSYERLNCEARPNQWGSFKSNLVRSFKGSGSTFEVDLNSTDQSVIGNQISKCSQTDDGQRSCDSPQPNTQV